MGERLIRGTTLAERRRQRRAALLASGLELFGTRGYAGTTVEEICRHANVSSRNFYEEFDNRLDLLRAVSAGIAERALAGFVAAEPDVAAPLTVPRARLRVGALAHALLDDPRVARVMFVENIAGWARYPDLMDDIVGPFAAWLRTVSADHLDARGVPPGRQAALVVGLVGATIGVLADWVRSPGERRPIDEVVDDIVALAAAILGLPGAGDDARG